MSVHRKRIVSLILMVAIVFSALSGAVLAAPEPEEIPSLKDTLDMFYIGTCVQSYELDNEKITQQLLTHYNTITAGNEMKPDAILGRTPTIGPDGYPVLNFTNGDKIAQYAEENGLTLRGHTLVWHSQTPSWFFKEDYSTAGSAKNVDRDVMLERMEWYIKSVVEHFDTAFPGLIYAWDVVNEAAAENNVGMRGSNPAGGSGTSLWYETIGPDYVTYAFEYARKYADESVLLFYNDYAINGALKRQSVIDLLMPAIEAGNVDGIGMQSHHHINMNIPGFEESARVFATLVDHIDITELDCQSTTNPVEDGFLAQATWYHNFFESLKALKADGVPIDNVVFWGMDDDTSWKRTGKPLLFDGDYNPKQAFWAIMGERGFRVRGADRYRL